MSKIDILWVTIQLFNPLTDQGSTGSISTEEIMTFCTYKVKMIHINNGSVSH
jgi:hypothetical protein